MQYIRNSISSFVTYQPNQQSIQNSETQLSQSQSFPTSQTIANGTTIIANRPVVITTVTRNPPQTSTGLSVINEYESSPNRLSVNSNKKVKRLPTPSDSYHSVLSDFPNDNFKQDGGISNPAYAHTEGPIVNNNSNRLTASNRRVTIRESYWTWHCCWETWTTREKILLLVVVILTVTLCVIVGLLGLFAERNRTYLRLLEEHAIQLTDRTGLDKM